MEEDLAVAKSEWGAEFRSDLEFFVSQEAVDAVVVAGRLNWLRRQAFTISVSLTPLVAAVGLPVTVSPLRLPIVRARLRFWTLCGK